MANPSESHALRRDLRASLADGGAYSLMVGVGEAYLPAFALAIGLGEVTTGFVATVPLLGGSVLQLISPQGVRWLGSPRRWVILCAAVQAMSFIPLIAAAWVGRIAAPLMLLIASVYWGGGLGAGPAWNTWMGRLVPTPLRPGFFARRTRVTQVTVFIGLLVGGGILQLYSDSSHRTVCFVITFTLAACFRFISTLFLALMREPVAPPQPDRRVSLKLFAERLVRRDGRLFAYMLVMTVSAQLAGPYFTPYMLRELRMSYATYVLLLSMSFLAKVIVLPIAARFARRYSVRHLLWAGGLGVVPLAALWVISSSVPYLVLVQLVSGMFWAAYELATFLLVYEAVPDEERVSALTAFTLFNSVTMVLGASLGGSFLYAVGKDQNAYMLLFVISTLARLVSLPLLRSVTQMPLIPARIGLRTLGVRPGSGSIDGPILVTIPATADSRHHPGEPRSQEVGNDAI